ncbi:hypothetical protein FHX34_106173 [Actinoplanes teichomyceticus]|uniref:Pycsar effector protein domain-containing protein n=2 Tax=Actinoplanes teichomyceticus TaxID=1867 RepID=A0A561VIK3_ACTTI|nr:hypothetical protein FHX34_106173 [Actinoplanes teichomyceticus]GIF15743.1 hypothetical protein Ate01nite_57750 [Actinoplanes teichomyceticus]
MTAHPGVDSETANVRGEIYSANTQASIVLATIAIAVGPFAANAGNLIDRWWLIKALVLTGCVAAFGAVWFLLNVVLPRLDASGRGSFLHWARLDRDSLRDALGQDYQLDELLVLSRIATAKYRSLRRAGRLLKTGLVMLGTAIVLNLIH